jgi:hypothetical protein
LKEASGLDMYGFKLLNNIIGIMQETSAQFMEAFADLFKNLLKKTGVRL